MVVITVVSVVRVMVVIRVVIVVIMVVIAVHANCDSHRLVPFKKQFVPVKGASNICRCYFTYDHSGSSIKMAVSAAELIKVSASERGKGNERGVQPWVRPESL